MRVQIHSLSNEIRSQVGVWYLHALQLNIEGGHFRRKTAN